MRLSHRRFALTALALVACSDGEDLTRPELGGLSVPLPQLSVSTVLASGGTRVVAAGDSAPARPHASGTGDIPLIHYYAQSAFIGFWSWGGAAETTASLSYFGTSGRIETTVKAVKGTTLLGAVSAPVEDQSYIPWMREITNLVQVPFSDPCGVRNESTSHYIATLLRLPPFDFASTTRSRSDFAELAPCVPPPEIVGRTKSNGTDEDSGWAICWYQIWYNGSGVVISTQELYCEPL